MDLEQFLEAHEFLRPKVARNCAESRKILERKFIEETETFGWRN